MSLDLEGDAPTVRTASTKVRKLLPVGFKGCTHQFSLQFLPDGSCDLPNRAGGLAALSAPSINVSLPDLGDRNAMVAGLGGVTGVQMRMDSPPPELLTAGELTLLIRVACCPYWTLGAPYGFAVSMGDYNAAAGPGNHLYSLVCHQHGQGPATLRYYAAHGGRSTILFDSTNLPPTPRSGECVLSLRRNAAGTVVRLGVNSSFESSGALAAPDGGTQAKLAFGESYGSTTNSFVGKLADFNFAPGSMSDAEVSAAVAFMLGT